MRELTFKNGFEVLTLPELKSSVDERMFTDKPFHGIQHYSLLEEIGEILNKTNKNAIIDDIIVSPSGPSIAPGISKIPFKVDEYGKNAVEAHIFRRLITSFIIEHDNPTFNTKLAVSYHQQGVSIAFGANVRICSNLSIFGYKYMHELQKSQYANSFDIIRGWLSEYDENIVKFEHFFQKLHETTFNLSDTFNLIGKLTSMRVEKDSKSLKNFINERNNYSLNQGQISKFAESVLIMHKEKGALSGYDVYNVGTQLHKPEFTEVSNIIPQNTEFGEVMLEYIN